MSIVAFIKQRLFKTVEIESSLAVVDDLLLTEYTEVHDISGLEEYRARKKMEEQFRNSPDVILGMTQLEYIRYRNPTTYAELDKILKSLWIADMYDILKAYTTNNNTEYPHYIGVKVRIHYLNGTTLIFPPTNEVIEVPRDIDSVKCKHIMIKRRRTT